MSNFLNDVDLNTILNEMMSNTSFIDLVQVILVNRYAIHLPHTEIKNYFNQVKQFNINENVFESDQDTLVTDIHIAILKAVSEALLSLLFFEGMKIKPDANTIKTPYRIVKSWFGRDLTDYNELLSGRWTVQPEITVFPNENNSNNPLPVTVTVELNAMCSHHLIRFGTIPDNKTSKAVISYVPDKYILGLSKFTRFINWISRRGWTQEELTKKIAQHLENVLKPKGLYVGLINIQHGCSVYRGVSDHKNLTTTEYYTGIYRENPSLVEHCRKYFNS